MFNSLSLPITWRVYCRSHHISYCLHTFIQQLSTKVSPATSSPPFITKTAEPVSIKNGALLERTKCDHVPPLVAPASVGIKPLPVVSQQKAAVENKETWKEMKIDYSQLPRQYLMLSKFRLTSLVVMTSMAGYALAPAPFDLSTLLMCSVGTGLVSCAANSVNQFLEVPFDSQMSRTKNRVLVRGALTPLHAITFAAVCTTTGLATLYWGTNGLTAALGATNLLLYTLVYTPMKRVSILNTWIGSVVGAIPPLMGWASCMGCLGPGAWIMAGLLYAWQFPHFNALSWNLRPDYSKAGYRMMSVTNPGLCRRTALRYTAGILVLCCLAPALDVTTWWFALEATPLNIYFTYLAWRFHEKSDSGNSRKLFRFSLLHLPILMLLMLVNKKHWASNTETDKTVKPSVSSDVCISAVHKQELAG